MQQIEFQESEESLNLRKIIGKYLVKWPWFIASVLLFVTIAFIYLRYAVPQYESTTTLKFDKKQSDLTGALIDLDNLGLGLGNADELKSEVAVVNSRPILMKVVENLNLNIQYYNSGEIRDSELFIKVPIVAKIISYKNTKKFVSSQYMVKEVNGNEFVLEDKENKKVKGTFDKNLALDFGTVVLQKVPGLTFKDKYKIVFWNPIEKVKSLEKKIQVDLPDQKAMLMDIKIVGTVPEKSEAILNEVTKQYNLDGLRDKNLQAQNTQEFIDKRLEVISRDLSGVENQKEDFQNRNRIVDLQAQAQLALQNTNDNTKQILIQQTQLDLLNSLQNEASKGDNQLMPSNLGLNPSLEQAILQYNNLVITRNKTLKQATNENPAVIEMNKEISSLKEIVRDNIRQQKATVQASIAQINSQISASTDMIEKVPGQSKIYRGIERQQNLKEQLFLFLLQKREENAINLSVNVPKAKIVNPAYTDDIPVSPKKNIILLAAALLGLMLPLGVFYLFFMWDDKIYSRTDITENSPLGVLADIPSLKDDQNHLVQRNDFSELAESFRILVSNLKFLLPKKDSAKVILVTSSVKGEGKTLVSVNLALTLGSKNGRSLLIGSDVRNPQIQRYDDERVKNAGLTEYLYDETTDIEDLIHISDTNPECDVIYAGSIPPNPQELLSNGRYQKLISEMSSRYEYIVIDSAPLMLVSDTLSISDTADASLYVVRSGVSRKILIDFANKLVKESKISNVSFVINDVSKNVGGYGYGYNYGYGYGYTADKKKNWWQKLFNK
ncbi:MULTISPECIES: GumC family protein [Chryseobacterium]|uniref:non-specific protein-tyrosine kinase n=1 Tax=Chryseobacterium cucumeris TaxID=1813611 RepID=A0ABX9XAP7_9FLAO|nr:MULTISPECIES: polysaccharide biosynthesis tyrosine autokinase [Chryseobacterium]MDH5034494.1 polysaccharide biosynthesis tyrosine autokinase [Chryseobacterium cucumeris]ROH95356.1 polysaccharide biosynthesis tyrosine autokinase [Chryseobacterium cucumeris]WFB67320.1 polysaccharide biosynthesis tyrosine autokinase [Chryseobacterium sp. WX]WNI36493.1 polysaccharide biosynthesis tyrosine autokinase [Chryseobacterium sp. SG20098]